MVLSVVLRSRFLHFSFSLSFLSLLFMNLFFFLFSFLFYRDTIAIGGLCLGTRDNFFFSFSFISSHAELMLPVLCGVKAMA